MAGRLVVVGASLAGLRAVEAARTADPHLAISLVGAEAHAPYDRPPLSKDLLAADATREHSELRAAASLRDELGVELRLGEAATALDPAARTITVGDDTLDYAQVVLATGSTPRELTGIAHLAGVHTLRTLDDSRAIRAALDAGARTVVVGGGFVGAEVAAAARARDLDVTVVEALPAPLVRAVGTEIGVRLGALHDAHGASLLVDAAVDHVTGTDRVESVVLADGTVLPADLVVVGIGADPNVGWLESSGLTLDDGVLADETLRAADGVWVAGDIARWPNAALHRTMRVEHWTNAAEQGTRAGRNAANPEAAEPYSAVPYVWSDVYGSRIQLVGAAAEHVEYVWGDPAGRRWLALYRHGDTLTGAVGFNAQRVVMRVRRLVGGDWQQALDAAADLPAPKQEQEVS